MIDHNEETVGYALLIHYWSNEYGGMLLFLDELFISEPFRGKGIGAAFLEALKAGVFYKTVGLVLEVMPSNERALKLYLDHGFVLDERNHLFCKL